MAFVVKEIREGNTITANRDGGSAVRSFTVNDDAGVGVSVASTYNLPGIPDANSPHPDNGTPGSVPLFAETFTRIRRGNGVLVTVGYGSTPTAGGSLIPINPLADGFLTIEVSFQIDRVELPVFRRAKHTFGEGDNAVVKYIWERLEGDFSFDSVRHTFTAKLNGSIGHGLSVDQFLAAGATIRAQANKLHDFGGQLYRYVPRLLTQRTVPSGSAPALYDIQHSWQYDPGIPNTLFGLAGYTLGNGLIFWTSPDDDDPSHAFTQQDATFMLRPFSRVQAFANIEDPSRPPSMQFSQVYPVEPLGWQSLPGLSS
jgi:hypothetical protein